MKKKISFISAQADKEMVMSGHEPLRFPVQVPLPSQRPSLPPSSSQCLYKDRTAKEAETKHSAWNWSRLTA